MRYRKLPVVIEAEQFKLFEVGGLSPEFKAAVCWEADVITGPSGTLTKPHIHTLEGFHEVTDGDFIIKGVKGEFYPCKPDIFEKTYEQWWGE